MVLLILKDSFVFLDPGANAELMLKIHNALCGSGAALIILT